MVLELVLVYYIGSRTRVRGSTGISTCGMGACGGAHVYLEAVEVGSLVLCEHDVCAAAVGVVLFAVLVRVLVVIESEHCCRRSAIRRGHCSSSSSTIRSDSTSASSN